MDAAAMVRMARRRAQISQRELGRRAGIPQATISRIENRVVSPTMDTLEPLIRACGMELHIADRASDGVDLTLIREALRRSPAERLRYSVVVARRLDAMRLRAREVSA
ncbi:MAG TPA: helix-turn-helix transcriptional regulator [Actinomycetota bacterium]